MDNEHLHDGHFKRVRTSFKSGVIPIYPHQILEYILIMSKPRRDVNPSAHRLINNFGDLYGVFTAEENELTEVKGVSPKMAKLIKNLYQSTMILDEKIIDDYDLMDSKEEYFKRYKEQISKLEEKETFISFLHGNHDLIFSTKLKSKYYRDKMGKMSNLIIRLLDSMPFKIVIMSRYSPDDSYKPSNNDIIEVKKYYVYLKCFDILLEDFIVITPNGYYSFKEHNIFDIISALEFGEENYIRSVLNKPENQIIIAQIASKIKGTNISVMEKSIIACCNFDFSVMIQDIFK